MDDDGAIELELLGRWRAGTGGHVVAVGPRQQRLLAALAVHGERSRRFLEGLLWPEDDEAHARGSLRAAVFALTRRLPGALECRGAGLALGPRVVVDLHGLRRELEEPAPDGPDAGRRAAAADRRLLAGCRAGLLPGWYDDWVLEEQERLGQQCVVVLERRAGQALAVDDPYRALLLASAARDLDPLRESAVRALVRAHLALGNEAAAERACREHADALARELGAAPSPRLTGLVRTARGA